MSSIHFAEDRLVARFWILATIPDRASECTRAAGAVREKHFIAPGRGAIWRVLAARFAAGRSLQFWDPELRAELNEATDPRVIEAVWSQADADRAGDLTEQLARIAKPVMDASRARDATVFWNSTAREAGERLERGDDAASILTWTEDKASKLLEAVRNRAADRRMTPAQIIEDEIRALTEPGYTGIAWPWPKFQRKLGMSLRPGYFFGVTGLAGAGKSTWLGNLFVTLILRGVPCIAAITEEPEEWLRRAWASAADVPQTIAEPQAWDASNREVLYDLMNDWSCDADAVRKLIDEYRPRMEATLRAVHPSVAPWDLLTDDLSVDALMSKAAAIRRKWRGRQVVLLLDHAHNLAFPDGGADRHIGEACRRLKAFVSSDDDGGMTLVSLFQPRKPPRADPTAAYHAINAQDIAGAVARHLTGHVSVYRQRVLADPHLNTEWGTPRVATYAGHPQLAKVQSEDDADSMDDDQHIWFYADKRRRAGRHQKEKFYLPMNAPSGRIYEPPSFGSRLV